MDGSLFDSATVAACCHHISSRPSRGSPARSFHSLDQSTLCVLHICAAKALCAVHTFMRPYMHMHMYVCTLLCGLSIAQTGFSRNCLSQNSTLFFFSARWNPISFIWPLLPSFTPSFVSVRFLSLGIATSASLEQRALSEIDLCCVLPRGLPCNRPCRRPHSRDLHLLAPKPPFD